jgi:phospholipid transport system transporter-binding protein
MFDLSTLKDLDSSAVAVLLAWQRLAKEKSVLIQFEQVPSNLKSLLNLYGVADLLVIRP